MPKMWKPDGKGISFGSVMGHPVGGTTIVKKGDFVGDKNYSILLQKLRLHRTLYRKILDKTMTINAGEPMKHSATVR